MSDIHYLIAFVIPFFVLGIISPLLNEEFSADLDECNDDSGLLDEGDAESGSYLTFWHILGNILLLPFWTFGLPGWLNLWILLPIRIVFAFIIARNIWIGGGG